MAISVILSIIICAFSLILPANGLNKNSFDAYYSYLWGGDHFSVDPHGTEALLKIDKSSGAGFKSRWNYGSGMFHMRIKIPERKTQGIVTSFYLTTAPDDNPNPGNYSEINYEFLGTNGLLQTNIYTNDTGNRQQKFKLWFDPSKDFHTYEFLWNSDQIVWFVDSIPIRVFKKAPGVGFVVGPMHIQASIWNLPSDGPVDWAQAPFIAHFKDFGFGGCRSDVAPDGTCDSEKYFWNGEEYRRLSGKQQQLMADYRKKYLIYDYCLDPSKWRKECSVHV